MVLTWTCLGLGSFPARDCIDAVSFLDAIVYSPLAGESGACGSQRLPAGVSVCLLFCAILRHCIYGIESTSVGARHF